MSSVTIALQKALKVKNRLAGRLAKVTNDIRTYNSVLVETKDEVNVPKLLEQRQALVESMVQLKTAIDAANVGIQEKLYVLAEKKALLSMYSTLPVLNGKQRHDYQNTEIEYYAHIKKEEIDKTVKVLESDIDKLQDVIDEFNALTKILVPQRVLDLGS